MNFIKIKQEKLPSVDIKRNSVHNAQNQSLK